MPDDEEQQASTASPARTQTASFLSRLLSAGSWKRERLEDFLTEVLAEIVNRMPPEFRLAFCANFPIGRQDAPRLGAWMSFVEAHGTLTCRTQVRIRLDLSLASGELLSKRPDIVFFAGETPVLVLENKIRAGFTSSASRDEIDEAAAAANDGWQLPIYEKWIEAQAGFPAPVVLLTHASYPKDGWMSLASHPFRRVRRWAALGHFLKEMHHPPETKPLVDDFLQTLEEKNLMSDAPTNTDFAAMRLILADNAYFRLEAAILDARAEVSPWFKAMTKTNGAKAYPWSDESGAYFTADVFTTPEQTINIVWGYWFGKPEALTYWGAVEPPLTECEGAIVYVQFDDHPRGIQRPDGDAFQDWHFSPVQGEEATYLLKLRSFASASSRPLSAWFADSIKEAIELVRIAATIP